MLFRFTLNFHASIDTKSQYFNNINVKLPNFCSFMVFFPSFKTYEIL